MLKTKIEHDILQRAASQLAELQQEIDQATAICHEQQARITHCEEQTSARSHDLARQEQQVQDQKNAYEQAQLFAQLATGTAEEANALTQVRGAQEAYTRALREFEQAEASAQQATRSEREQIAHARATIGKKERAIQELQAKHARLHAVHESLVTRRGQELKAAALAAIDAQHSRIAEARHAVAQAEADVEALFDAQLATLADYPDLRAEVARLRQYSDSTSRVIASALAHVETLLTEYSGVQYHLDLEAVRYEQPWIELLSLPSEWLYGRYSLLNGSSSEQLGLRKEKLQHVLQQYVDSVKASIS